MGRVLVFLLCLRVLSFLCWSGWRVFWRNFGWRRGTSACSSCCSAMASCKQNQVVEHRQGIQEGGSHGIMQLPHEERVSPSGPTSILLHLCHYGPLLSSKNWTPPSDPLSAVPLGLYTSAVCKKRVFKVKYLCT